MNGITIDRQGAFHNRSNGQYAVKPGASAGTDLDWNSNQTQAWANARKSFAKTVNSPEAEEVFDKVKVIKGVGIAVVAAGLVSACGGAPAAESTPTYPDGDSTTTVDYESNVTNSYDDEDYDLGDYYDDYEYEAQTAGGIQPGSVFPEHMADHVASVLRNMDAESRGSMVLVNRDGVFTIADADSIQVGDRLDSNAPPQGVNLHGFVMLMPEDVVFARQAGVPVFQTPDGSEAFVFDRNDPFTPEIRGYIATAANPAPGTDAFQNWIRVNQSFVQSNIDVFIVNNQPTAGRDDFSMSIPGSWITGPYQPSQITIPSDRMTSRSAQQTINNWAPVTNAHPNIPIIGSDGEFIRPPAN